MHLVWVSSLVITAARPTSEPVPAVVGIATTGAMAAVCARRQLSPRSSKSQIGRVWPAMKATALAASRPLPPPSAITPSWLAGAKRLDAGLDIRGGRIGPDVGEQIDREAGGARDLQHPMADHVLGERRVGDQQRPGDAERAAGLRQLGHPPRPEPHPGGIAPVGAKRLRIDRVHASVSSAWMAGPAYGPAVTLAQAPPALPR